MGARADDRGALFAAETTVRADMLFTLSAVVAQPVTGALLIRGAGFDWTDRWLVLTYALYAVAGACWLPVVWIQIRLRDQLRSKLSGGPFDAAAHRRLRRWWFWLGWPAFGALLLVFHLMVTKPSW